MIRFKENTSLAGIKDCHIVCFVHDEVIVECNQQDAEDVKLLLKDAMENAVILPGVDLVAKPAIANNLADLK
jgi:DNA polymerase I-like protein with 3'-5' exonuclease and polymerase domains